MRFLPNPHYEAELRELTGLDAAWSTTWSGSDGIARVLRRSSLPLLDYLLPAYEHEGKSHLTVGVGCTGGRHRSVVIAEHLARVYESARVRPRRDPDVRSTRDDADLPKPSRNSH